MMPSLVVDGRSAGSSVAGRIDDIRGRVATALNTPTKFVDIDGHEVGSAGLVMLSWGTAAGVRFFAKIFLVDPYPVTPRFATPAEELATTEIPRRTVEEQIAAEWSMAQAMRSLAGTQDVPALLGHSVNDRILVFEEVKGLRLDRWVNWSWLHGEKARSMEAALPKAAAWLRRVHDSSTESYEVVDLGENVEALHALLLKLKLENTSYAELALKVLASARQKLGSRVALRVPVALNHGDFTLSNLMWELKRQHLWIIDFELSARQTIVHDLSLMIFDLRKRLLDPMTSPRTVRRCEKAFWNGYGEISEDLLAVVNALATARIFYASLTRISTWRERSGWAGSLKASIYRGLFQPSMLARILQAT